MRYTREAYTNIVHLSNCECILDASYENKIPSNDEFYTKNMQVGN